MYVHRSHCDETKTSVRGSSTISVIWGWVMLVIQNTWQAGSSCLEKPLSHTVRQTTQQIGRLNNPAADHGIALPLKQCYYYINAIRGPKYSCAHHKTSSRRQSPSVVAHLPLLSQLVIMVSQDRICAVVALFTVSLHTGMKKWTLQRETIFTFSF